METLVLDWKSEWRLLSAAAMLLLFVALGAILLQADWPATKIVQACSASPQTASVSMSTSPYLAAKIGIDPSALSRAEGRDCRD